MSYPNIRKNALLALLSLPCAIAQSDLDALLARLNSGPFEETTLYALEGHPHSPRILPALETAFEQRQAKDEKQAIAGTLLRLGDKSQKYFEFLASYAREAVEDRTPFSMAIDDKGREIKGQFSADFENWCARNGKEPKAVAAVQWVTYPADVFALAEAQDPRSAELLRKGLESPYPVVVAVAVRGLGRLQDLPALQMIAHVCEHLSPSGKRAVAMELPWYGSPEAYRLMGLLEPDSKLRDYFISGARQLQQIEQQRVLNRAEK